MGMELAGHKCVGFCENDKFAVMSYTAMHLATDSQIEHLNNLNYKDRQKEILKNEYKNGEWYADDIKTVKGSHLPKADCWCFGAPCQDFSVSKWGDGLKGKKSSLIREIFRLLGEVREEDRPEWLLYENVKGMLSSNKGFDFLAILLEMDRCGYDTEWVLFNSKHHGVPQNRERVYTIGHLRSKGERKILPITKTSREDTAQTVDSILNKIDIEVIGNLRPKKDCYGEDRERVIGINGVCPTMRATDYKEPIRIGIPVKHTGVNNMEPEVNIELEDGNTVYAIWYEKYKSYIAIRKLTPKEYFRLQGWGDNYFEKARIVNSDTQLYKQAGNGVTVNIAYEIGSAIS